jgi:hypothetical protein
MILRCIFIGKKEQIIMKRNALGLLTGIISNLCVYEVDGVQIVRSLPHRGQCNSTSQLANQRIFAKRVAWAKKVNWTLLNRVWKYAHFSVGGNPLNHFLKINNSAFSRTDQIKFPELLIVSEGSLSLAPELGVVRKEGQLEFSWTPHDDTHSHGNDLMNIVFLQDDGGLDVRKTTVCRSDCKALLSVPASAPKEGYVFWSSINDRAFSRSVYWKV